MLDDGGLDYCLNSGGGKMWTDLRFVLKGKPTRFSDGSDTSMKYDSKVMIFMKIRKISFKISLTP